MDIDRHSLLGEVSNTNLLLKNVHFEEMAEQSSTGTIVTASESLQEHQKAEDAEHMKLFEEIISFYALVSKLTGFEIKFNWRWEKSFLFWIAILVIIAVYICIGYTMFDHYRNEDYVRILEPLVISGLLISVSLNLDRELVS